jgi:hypothetical protein
MKHGPTILAWALAQPAGTRGAVLAAAVTGGTTRVTLDGRTVEYHSLDELGRALSLLHAAEGAAARRPEPAPNPDPPPLMRRPGWLAPRSGWLR